MKHKTKDNTILKAWPLVFLGPPLTKQEMRSQKMFSGGRKIDITDVCCKVEAARLADSESAIVSSHSYLPLAAVTGYRMSSTRDSFFY